MLHLDSAAAGRSSAATLEAVRSHAELEASVGGYVAEQRAAPVLAAGRAALADLTGVAPDGLAFVESASAARAALLQVWPLRPGDRVAVVPSEWGPNLAAFAEAGLDVVELAVHGRGGTGGAGRATGDGPADAEPAGVVDLDALERLLAHAPPAVVHLTQAASHRALVQPVRAVAERCRSAGVPLWVDAAQSLGHLATACGADAVYATSRKWLAGPRGVGLLGVSQPWVDRLRIPAAARVGPGEGLPTVRLLESHEAHVAGRVGLAAAVAQHLAAGRARVHARLAEVGRRTREALSDVPGWEVVDPVGVPVAITALRLRAGDVAAARERLVEEHGVLTTAGLPWRAPRELREPLLRVSPHVDCTDDDLAVLHRALTDVAR